MLRNIVVSFLQGVLATIVRILLVTLIGVGVRLLMMLTLQQRGEHVNRWINERPRALIAAYKTLGGSFAGNLVVDSCHMRDIQGQTSIEADVTIDVAAGNGVGSARGRHDGDAIEVAKFDIILLAPTSRYVWQDA